MYVLGFDIGGTKIEANLIYFGKKSHKDCLLKFEYQDKTQKINSAILLSKKRVSTERHLGYPQILKKMAELAESLCKESGYLLKDIKGIGLSVPGPVHPKTGVMTMSNSMVMAGKKLHLDLKKALKVSIPVISENDANCFALAEIFCGAGLAYFKETKIPAHEQTAVGIILGSGCGGGIVQNGNLLRGKQGCGGEIGHSILYSEGHPCYCGRRGCAEQYVSGPALEALANSRLYSQITERPNAKKIFELYELMDPVALAVVKEYQKNLAFFLGSMSSILDPHYFVLGGGISLADAIYPDLENKIAQNTFIQSVPIKIYKHQIGDSAGAIGASLIVKDLCQI